MQNSRSLKVAFDTSQKSKIFEGWVKLSLAKQIEKCSLTHDEISYSEMYDSHTDFSLRTDNPFRLMVSFNKNAIPERDRILMKIAFAY